MTERSKIAARQQNAAKCRRERENKVLVELSRLLPIPFSVAVRLDKASVVRLSSAYLKLRELFPNGIGREWGEKSQPDGILKELGTFLNTAFDGFVFVLGDDAKILYVSEAASTHLGLSQLELIGNSLYNFIHEYDNSEVKKLMCHEQSIPALYAGNVMHEDIEVPRNFEIRMKCTLPKRQAELAVDGYKVIHCRGYLKLRQKTENCGVPDPSVMWYKVVGIVAAGHSLPSASIAEVKMHRRDFMFRTGLDLKFIYLEPRAEEIIGYEPSYLIDKSLYKFIHPWDCTRLRDVHLLVLTRTQAITKYYRFLTRGGGWIWIQSSCMIISSNKANSQHYILILNHVLSEREYEELFLDVEQFHKPRTKSFKSYNNFTKRSQKTRKKATSTDLNLATSSVHQVNPPLPPTAMKAFSLPNSQNEFHSQANAFAKNNVQSDFLECYTNMQGHSTNASNYLSLDNSGTYNNSPCSEVTYNFNSYGNACSSPRNHSVTDVKLNAFSMDLSAPGSISYPNIYINNQETVSSLSTAIHNTSYGPCYLESTKGNYLIDALTDNDFHASSHFTPSVKKVKTSELPSGFSAERMETNYVNDNTEVKEVRSSCNRSLVEKVETIKETLHGLSTSVPFMNVEQNGRIYESGSGELIPHPIFPLSEVNYEMVNYPDDKSYQLSDSTSWTQWLNLNSADLKQHLGNFEPHFGSGAADKQSFPASATIENCINSSVSHDFKNDVLPEVKETSTIINLSNETSTENSALSDLNEISQEQLINSESVIASDMSSMSPGLSKLESSTPLSAYNDFSTSSTEHFQNTDNFPVFSDIVNLITNVDIFPRLSTHEAYNDLAFNSNSDNNPLQICPGQSSSNKAIYIN